MGDQEQPTGGTHFVGKKDELIDAKRSLRTLEGRDILIIFSQGTLYAMDAYCYREYGFSSSQLKPSPCERQKGLTLDKCPPSLNHFKKKLPLIETVPWDI